MPQLGDLRFDCPYCGHPVTVPVHTLDGGKFTVTAAINLGAIREHYTTVHPKLAEPAGEAVTGDESAESGELRDRGR